MYHNTVLILPCSITTYVSTSVSSSVVPSLLLAGYIWYDLYSDKSENGVCHGQTWASYSTMYPITVPILPFMMSTYSTTSVY